MFYGDNTTIAYGSGNSYDMENLPNIFSGKIMDKEMLI